MAPKFVGTRFYAEDMSAVGDLVRSTTGAWIIRPPMYCPTGHRFGPCGYLVGFAHCSHRGGHTTWWCRECGATVYGPPLGAGCSLFNGPDRVTC
jgi:hypothetical protein